LVAIDFAFSMPCACTSDLVKHVLDSSGLGITKWKAELDGLDRKRYIWR